MPNASVSFAIFMANCSLAQFFHPLCPCSMEVYVLYVSVGAIMYVSQSFPPNQRVSLQQHSSKSIFCGHEHI